MRKRAVLWFVHGFQSQLTDRGVIGPWRDGEVMAARLTVRLASEEEAQAWKKQQRSLGYSTLNKYILATVRARIARGEIDQDKQLASLQSRLDSMERERDELREEVATLRRLHNDAKRENTEMRSLDHDPIQLERRGRIARAMQEHLATQSPMARQDLLSHLRVEFADLDLAPLIRRVEQDLLRNGLIRIEGGELSWAKA